MTREEISKWTYDPDVMQDNIILANNIVQEIGKKDFIKKGVICTVLDLPTERHNNNSLPLMSTSVPFIRIVIYPKNILFKLKEYILSDEKVDRKNRKYMYRCNQSLNFNNLSEGDLYMLLRSMIVECLIHEYFHINQYIRFYSESRRIHENLYSEYPAEMEERIFLYAHLIELKHRVNITPVLDARFICYAMYFEKDYFKKMEPNSNYFKINYPESDITGSDEIINFRKLIARVVFKRLYGINCKYKKASLEYMLAIQLLLCTDVNSNYINANYDKLIKEMRKNIRAAQYFEYNNIIWKENGEYVNRIANYEEEYYRYTDRIEYMLEENKGGK